MLEGVRHVRRGVAAMGIAVFLSSARAHADSGEIPIYQLDVPFTITNSGSYVVAEPIFRGGLGGSAIYVEADDVVLDLGGNSVGGSLFSRAIYQSESRRNLTIRNGSVWQGIQALGGNGRIENLRITESLDDALTAGPDALIRSCVIVSNALVSSTGALIRAGSGARIRDCLLVDNSGLTLYGIDVGSGSCVERCELLNGRGTNGVYALVCGEGSVIRDCKAYFVAPDEAATRGLVAGARSVIEGVEVSGFVTLGAGVVARASTFSSYYSWDDFGATVGDGCALDDCGFYQGLFPRLDIGSGVVIGDSYLGSAYVFVNNGSLIDRCQFSLCEVTLVYDNLLINSFLADSCVIATQCCNRIDGNHVYADSYASQIAAFHLFGDDNLVIRNRYEGQGSTMQRDGSGDHVAARVYQTIITDNKPWGNIQTYSD